MAKDSFEIYKSFYPPIQHLTDEQLGRLFRAIFRFQIEGEREVSPDIEMAFSFFVSQFETDRQKYETICLKRSAANGGGRPKKQEQPPTTTTRQDAEDSFNRFWEEYHRITGLPKTDKDAAFKYWKKLTKTERTQALARIDDYFHSLNNPKYCKKARTYLADKNFNDEYDDAPGGFIVPR